MGRKLHLHAQRHLGRFQNDPQKGLLLTQSEGNFPPAVGGFDGVVGNKRHEHGAAIQMLGYIFRPFTAGGNAVVVPYAVPFFHQLLNDLNHLVAVLMGIADKDIGLSAFVG